MAWLPRTGNKGYDPIPGGMDEEDGMDSSAFLHAENASHQQWAAIPNLDVFLTKVYKYYYEKGFYCILATRVTNLLSLGFTVLFSTVLLLFVDWSALLTTCESEETCHNIKFMRAPKFSIFTALVTLYAILFGLYWIWQCVVTVYHLFDVMEIRTFYTEKLGLTERDLQTIEWSEVVDRLVLLQKTMRLCIVKDTLTAHDIAMRVMRKENYLIAFFNKDILNLKLKGLPLITQPLVTETLEWNLHQCILDVMFDDKFMIRKSFLNDVPALRRRFVRMGLVNFALAPFILIFRVMYFFLRHTEELRNRPQELGARTWSPLARWKFRELNEFPDAFQKRLNMSYKPANTYTKLFNSNLLTSICRFISFVFGSFAGVLIVLSLLNESIILYVKVWETHNLLWYLAICGVVLAACRAVMPDENLAEDPEELMHLVSRSTHYFPKRWRGKCHSYDVYEEFVELLQYKIIIFLNEVLSVFLTPFILWFALPSCAGDIVNFVRDFTVNVDGVGHVCAYAVFDFHKYGNSKYGSTYHADKRQRTAHGKLEKSFLTFRANHPNWVPSGQGAQEFLGKMDQSIAETSIIEETFHQGPPVRIQKVTSHTAAHNGHSSGMGASSFVPQSPTSSYLGRIENNMGVARSQSDIMRSQSFLGRSQMSIRHGQNIRHDVYFDWLEKYHRARVSGGEQQLGFELRETEFKELGERLQESAMAVQNISSVESSPAAHSARQTSSVHFALNGEEAVLGPPAQESHTWGTHQHIPSATEILEGNENTSSAESDNAGDLLATEARTEDVLVPDLGEAPSVRAGHHFPSMASGDPTVPPTHEDGPSIESVMQQPSLLHALDDNDHEKPIEDQLKSLQLQTPRGSLFGHENEIESEAED